MHPLGYGMRLDLAARRAALSPDRQAVHAAGRWYTYADLNERAGALAGALAAAGVRAGDRVGILAHNHIAHIDLMLATAKLGFIHTPFNHRLSDREQAALGRYTDPSVILFDGPNAAAANAAAGSSGARLQSLTDYGDWLARSPGAPAAYEPDPEDTQMILFTGGTTGTPKGAELPYRQGVWNAVNTVMSWGISRDDCAVQATPCFHAAVNALTVPLLHAGGRVVMQSAFEPGEYLQLVMEHAATILFLVPTMFGMVARHEDFPAADLDSVSWAISGGAPCPDSLRDAYRSRGIRFRQGYGLTEAGVNCFSIETETAERLPQSVGQPMMHAHAAIRSPDGSLALPGETGELTLRGPHVFKGYFRQPEATAAVLRDGWLWTGDLARQDGDGNYYLAGRRKDMYISGGENVYPAEVENVICSCRGVAECAVVPVPDDRWGEVGVAFVVPADPAAGSDLDRRLADWLGERLARYKQPKRFVFVSSLPRSGAGKILKRDLLSQLEETA